jgi:hypothetical protein
MKTNQCVALNRIGLHTTNAITPSRFFWSLVKFWNATCTDLWKDLLKAVCIHELRVAQGNMLYIQEDYEDILCFKYGTYVRPC